MENDATREHRHVFSKAVEEYRRGLFDDPEVEKDVARDVAEKYGVSQKELRERAAAGA